MHEAAKRKPRIHALLAGAAACAVGVACQSDPPPLGEVLVVVDTDAPLTFVNRLRADLYDTEGHWLSTNDFPRLAESDWPVSFSVVTPTTTGAQRPAMVRLRGYRDSKIRPYEGERFRSRDPYEPPRAAKSVDEMCAAEAPLDAGKVRTVRVGPKKITGTPGCKYKPDAGAASVRIEISDPGEYRFEVLDYAPRAGADTALSLRRTCSDESSELDCNDDRTESDDRPVIEKKLAAGTYSLVIANLLETDGNTDVDVRWGPSASAKDTAATSDGPRLIVDGNDATPSDEPQPGVTIDRLVAVELVPGQRATIQVALRSACFGSMSRLGADSHTPTLDGAMTCVDETRPWEVVRSGELPRTEGIVRNAPRLPRTFGQVEACSAEPDDSERVCVPGGAFVMDDARVSEFRETSYRRFERVVEVDSFLVDRTKVTVAAWRAALRAGFSPPRAPVMNERALPKSSAGLSREELLVQLCSFSAGDRGREDYPLTCVDWASARAYCRFQGGDLPTEAQWIYAASVAGSTEPRRFPWGDTRPTCPTQSLVAPKDTEELRACCAQAVFGRSDNTQYGANTCLPYGIGPQPIGAGNLDRTPLGIVGLAGGVGEWALDAFAGSEHPCLAAEPVRNPRCEDDAAPTHTTHGNAFYGSEEGLLNGNLTPYDATQQHIAVGIRCVYPSRSP